MNIASVLKNRRFAIWVPLAVLLMLAIGLWIIFQGERNVRTEQRRALQVQAEILAANVTAALDFSDQSAAQESADALKVSPQVIMAGVFDANGFRFAGFARSQAVLPAHLSKIGPSPATPIQISVPVMRSGTRIGTVHVGGAIEPLRRRLSRYAIVTLLVSLTSLVLIVLSQGQTALRRVNRTLEEANRELQFQMNELGRAEEQLRQAQKMQALGNLTGGVAHDFNNLLAVIQGSAELLQRPNLPEEKRLKFTNAIIDASSHGALLTGQLLAFARRQPLRPEVIDLNQRIRQMLVMIQPTLGPNISLVTELDPALLPIEVDPGQFESALLNIIVNARDAMPDGKGKVAIRTRNAAPEESREGERTVIVAIEDNGSGIAPEQLSQVFEPFFTTKTVGKGTGLGLSQVYGFAAQSGGEARITSEVGRGTRLSILLPASNKPMPVAQTGPTVKIKAPGGRVLLVEDNDEVGNLAEALLGELGHEVLRARSGSEALHIVDEGAMFDIVFSDVVMPGMNGLELASLLKQRRPQLPIILTTGYSDRIAAAGSQGFPIVRKPYRMEALAQAVGDALASTRA